MSDASKDVPVVVESVNKMEENVTLGPLMVKTGEEVLSPVSAVTCFVTKSLDELTVNIVDEDSVKEVGADSGV